MPYVSQFRRTALTPGPTWRAEDNYQTPAADPENVGELTFVLYRAAVDYLRNPNLDWRMSYARHAEVVAALELAKLEFCRQYVTPFEDKAIERNGDI